MKLVISSAEHAEPMDHRLQQASLSGNLHALRGLLDEDQLLLRRPTTTDSSDSPLHIAASLGHADFTAELIRLCPGLTRDRDARGRTPLHLAAANGHSAVVRGLITHDAELCVLEDKDGLMPVHAAAAKGRLDVLRDLVDARPESVRTATGRGETVLHLAVGSGSFEAVEFLVERLGDGHEALNCRDGKGNTVLHLAVAKKQFQIVKFLLANPGLNLNSINLKGLTPLDVLLESPHERGDLSLGETIRAAGGLTSRELDHPPVRQTVRYRHKSPNPPRVNNDREDYRNTPGTIMVVATLIATITFQAGLNPPGGFVQEDAMSYASASTNENPTDQSAVGKVVLRKSLDFFLMFDVIGLFASLSIMLLFICVVPGRKRMVMDVLAWIMWAAVLSTALAFQCAIVQVYEKNFVVRILAFAWFGILRVAIVCICVRFAAFLLKRVGWWKGRARVGRGCVLVFKRIGVVMAVAAAVAVTVYLNFNLQGWITRSF